MLTTTEFIIAIIFVALLLPALFFARRSGNRIEKHLSQNRKNFRTFVDLVRTSKGTIIVTWQFENLWESLSADQQPETALGETPHEKKLRKITEILSTRPDSDLTEYADALEIRVLKIDRGAVATPMPPAAKESPPPPDNRPWWVKKADHIKASGKSFGEKIAELREFARENPEQADFIEQQIQEMMNRFTTDIPR
jgi:hypothetical protein